MLLILSALSAYNFYTFYRANAPGLHAVPNDYTMIRACAVTIAIEWLMLLYVWGCARRYGQRMRDLTGGRWTKLEAVCDRDRDRGGFLEPMERERHVRRIYAQLNHLTVLFQNGSSISLGSPSASMNCAATRFRSLRLAGMPNVRSSSQGPRFRHV